MMNNTSPFADWFRNAMPYIHAHRDKIFVLYFGGEALLDAGALSNLIHDVALLQGLGIRLVLVHGARPQIEQRLRARGAELRIHNGLRITDDAALLCVKEAAGIVRVEIEALLSMGVADSPMAGACIRVASGNFVTARPVGILDGIDHGHTGIVRKIDANAIRQRLDAGAIALLPPIGYSPTGEVFNLVAADLAATVAASLCADKLILLQEEDGLADQHKGIINHLLPEEAERLIHQGNLNEETRQQLQAAIYACRHSVHKVHLLNRHQDGALLQELFTRDGVGSLLSATPYEKTRPALIEDVGGILQLLAPLEASGALVRRSRELLETEIDRFVVVERDERIIGCAALYPYPDEGMAELACVAIHPDYRNSGRGDALLEFMETLALQQHLRKLFVLTTQTSHWFQERGFQPRPLDELPAGKKAYYNFQRNSRPMIKDLP